jgi:hypothetical protein
MTTTDQATEQALAPMLRIPRSAHPVPTATRLQARRVPLWALGLVLVALLTTLLVGANMAGLMTTMGGGAASTTEQVAPTGSDPDEVKGWMTIQQVLDAYPVTRAALFAQFDIPADTPTSTALREIMENASGSSLEIPALRNWLAEQVASGQ